MKKETAMLFLKIVVSLVLIVDLIALYILYIRGEMWDESQKIKKNQAVEVIGNLVVIHHPPDTFCVETEYMLSGMPEGQRAPTIILKRFYNGDNDIQFGSTPGQVQIDNLGGHKLALFEEALPNIREKLSGKKA